MRSLVRNLIRELSGAPWGPGILWLRASFLIFWRARVCACVRRQMQNMKLDKRLYKAWLARSLARCSPEARFWLPDAAEHARRPRN